MSFLQELLRTAFEMGTSDVHLVPGLPPQVRIHTILQSMEGYDVVQPQHTVEFVREMVPADRLDGFETHRDIDFSTEVEGVARFRVNAHFQKGRVAIAFRAIADHVPDISDLNLPAIVETFIDLPRGLLLVTGPTGSGKSTSLASMIDAMNHRYQHHIITLEDPIEYELRSDRCVIEQREVGIDVPNFASGLRHALRQDPDIILVGEMRDLETISAAMTAAETGHLVLSTLHTQNAHQTVERIIDVYPPAQQNQIRAMVSNTLQAVVSMTLLKRQDVPGMVPACEIMVCNAAVRNCIRENRLHEVPNIIETNRARGMCTLDDSIKTLYLNGVISWESAIAKAARPEALHRALSA
ncbi:MAG TPA: PilT/PilU family type 4a pilus ATPase [Phycisphaerae bacterium]|nr:PilT/PilU family type 4a pilus ATPase [Phycisphaerae bacterium]